MKVNEQLDRGSRYTNSRGRKTRRWMKRATQRYWRRLANRDPEEAPTRLPTSGFYS